MKKITEKIKRLNSQRTRHIVLRVCLGAFLLLVVWRFVSFGMDQNRVVFNMTRDAIKNGVPVSVIEMKKTDGVVYEPLFINDNRGYVSGMRIGRFAVGQKISDGGELVSVSRSLDLDSGMHIVRTRGASNGAHMVEIRENGFYVPTYAIKNGNVFVMRENVAHIVPVTVVRGDADNSMITGVADGDIVITSHVADGELVRVIK
jgi:hypothetical protein